MKQLLYLVLFFPQALLGQRTDEIITLRIGYTSTNIVFNEAVEPSINFFGITFNAGKTFVGDGPELGTIKNFNRRMYGEVSFSTFSGRDTKTKVNNHEHYYTLKGFSAPISINYLFRDSAKRLRLNLGAGVQFLQGHLRQYETISTNTGQTTNQVTDISISEVQLILRPGVQFRIISNLFTSFIVKVGISTNGRYTDTPSLSLKYTFRVKR